MTVRTVTNLPAVTHGETVRCLFAIELSAMSWVVAFNTPLSEKISRHPRCVSSARRDLRGGRSPMDVIAPSYGWGKLWFRLFARSAMGLN